MRLGVSRFLRSAEKGTKPTLCWSGLVETGLLEQTLVDLGELPLGVLVEMEILLVAL